MPVKTPTRAFIMRFFVYVMMFTGLVQVADGQTPANDQSPSEDNWWLPDYVKPSPNTGYYPMTLPLSWKEMNPEEGVYDFALLDEVLASGQDFWIVPYFADRDFVPEWVIAQYELEAHQFAYFPDYATQFGVWSEGYFVEIWDAGYREALSLFVNQLAQQPAFQSDQLKFMYIPGAWRWGEWETSFIEQMMEDGLSPESYLRTMEQLIDIFANAFTGNEFKLVWTGYDNPENGEGYEDWERFLGRKISSYAVSKGFGVRHGFTESFNWGMSDLPNWGSTLETVDGLQYVRVDDLAPLVADSQRIFATENECFGDCDESDMGRAVDRYYNEKMAHLKALQLRMRWIAIQEGQAERYPALYAYIALSLGKQVSDSPDAWVSLRTFLEDEFPSRWDGEHLHIVNNWERWLYQREISSDGLTQASYSAVDYMMEGDIDFGYPVFEARTTQHSQGSDYIYFNIDDRFSESYAGDYQLNISYLDNNQARWWVEYDAGPGDEYHASEQISNQQDGAWKTVSLTLTGTDFQNRQSGMDFRIFNGGESDITVRFVRIIKLSSP